MLQKGFGNQVSNVAIYRVESDQDYLTQQSVNKWGGVFVPMIINFISKTHFYLVTPWEMKHISRHVSKYLGEKIEIMFLYDLLNLTLVNFYARMHQREQLFLMTYLSISYFHSHSSSLVISGNQLSTLLTQLQAFATFHF